MSLDLGHICHAANTEAEVLPVQGTGDGAGDAGLAHARGPIEAEDLALGGAPELADGNEVGGGRTTGDGSPAGGTRSHLRELKGLMAVMSLTVIGYQEGGC